MYSFPRVNTISLDYLCIIIILFQLFILTIKKLSLFIFLLSLYDNIYNIFLDFFSGLSVYFDLKVQQSKV